jgi:two-component system response regulator AtoC/two-component system response regulator FlrC
MSRTEPTKIMIVDDDEQILGIFQEIFADESFQVFTAQNGARAITEMKRAKYDIAFIDIYMPEMDGLQVLAQLLLINPQLQAIMISGYQNISQLEKALSMGARHYLIKPLDMHDVLSVALKCLQHLGQGNNIELPN